MEKINPSNCCWKDLVNLAIKCGFTVFEGGNHTKVKSPSGELITTIPRHNNLDKFTVKGILKELIKAGADIKIVK